MSNHYTDQRLADLMDAFNSGLYQHREVVSVCMDLLADEGAREKLWVELPEWISVEIKSRLASFGEADELVTFGRGKPEVVKAQMLNLKHWLSTKRND
jgi:hypothetical protein